MKKSINIDGTGHNQQNKSWKMFLPKCLPMDYACHRLKVMCSRCTWFAVYRIKSTGLNRTFFVPWKFWPTQGAAVAYVADMMMVPTIFIKAVTDLVDGEKPTAEEFLQNLATVTASLARSITQVIDFISGKSLSELWRSNLHDTLLVYEETNGKFPLRSHLAPRDCHCKFGWAFKELMIIRGDVFTPEFNRMIFTDGLSINSIWIRSYEQFLDKIYQHHPVFVSQLIPAMVW